MIDNSGPQLDLLTRVGILLLALEAIDRGEVINQQRILTLIELIKRVGDGTLSEGLFEKDTNTVYYFGRKYVMDWLKKQTV